MKNTIAIIALGLVATLAAAPASADESIDCFYEANRSDSACQANAVVMPAPVPFTRPEYIALENTGGETVDCFYEANRSHSACAIVHNAAK